VNKKPLITYKQSQFSLNSPTAMPLASTFLWNTKMMVQINCRGYATAQFMQPEPAKYARGPALEPTTFMQPEQGYYAHHPGRFFYVKDEQAGTIFSAPYEPVRQPLDKFEFICASDHVMWKIEHNAIALKVRMQLDAELAVELWEVSIQNLDKNTRQISLYPYFPVGYMSWMNQSAHYHSNLNAIICKSITPYQKYSDYFKQKHFKDSTFFMAKQVPYSWDCRQSSFEGEGGLQSPEGVKCERLTQNDADYETPTAALQYRFQLPPTKKAHCQFLFGPAENEQEVSQIREQFFQSDCVLGYRAEAYEQYINQSKEASGKLSIKTPDDALDHFVNHWLLRSKIIWGLAMSIQRKQEKPFYLRYLNKQLVVPCPMAFCFLKKQN